MWAECFHFIDYFHMRKKDFDIFTGDGYKNMARKIIRFIFTNILTRENEI